MIIPYEAVRDWLAADPAWASYGFAFSQGLWRDTATNAAQRICHITPMGAGAGPDPEVDYDSVRVTLLGPQKGQADMIFLRNLAYQIRERLKVDYKVCDVSQLRLQAAPIGPNFTAEERPWMELNILITS